MITKTITDIIAKCVAVVEALTPDAPPSGRLFALNRAPSRELRLWIPEAGENGMFRRFDIHAGPRSDLGTNLVTAVQVMYPVTITFGYPSDPKLFGLKERYEIEALVASDIRQVRDALQRPAGLAGSGHVANIITDIPALDRGRERHFFQDLRVQAIFYTAQRS